MCVTYQDVLIINKFTTQQYVWFVALIALVNKYQTFLCIEICETSKNCWEVVETINNITRNQQNIAMAV